MRSVSFAAILFCLGWPSAAYAVGFSHDETFIVYAPDRELADKVLAKANEFRRAEAKELLGCELGPAVGRTIITVEVSATEDSGFTWPIDHPDRKFHNMWLTTSRERATGSTLRHEIRHVVLNTKFPDRLPPWIEEGLASRSDDAGRQQEWRDTAAAFSRLGWPDINSVIEARSIAANDQAAYGASTSLVNYLLTRGDVRKLLDFAIVGKKSGWDRACDQCYGIQDRRRLEAEWHQWVVQGRAVTKDISLLYDESRRQSTALFR